MVARGEQAQRATLQVLVITTNGRRPVVSASRQRPRGTWGAEMHRAPGGEQQLADARGHLSAQHVAPRPETQ
eukprot:10061107-Alexandrium_andersonii.AAC.1